MTTSALLALAERWTNVPPATLGIHDAPPEVLPEPQGVEVFRVGWGYTRRVELAVTVRRAAA